MNPKRSRTLRTAAKSDDAGRRAEPTPAGRN